MFPGTFYLTECDNKFRRYYKIKDATQRESKMEQTFNWTGDLQSNKTSNQNEIVDDSEYSKELIEKHPVLSRLSALDSQFTSNTSDSH